MKTTITRYEEFLRHKQIKHQDVGMTINPNRVHPMLFPFQRDIVVWALRKGRAAIFADTGLGKTFLQLEWARLLGERTLIVAPLSVAKQTVREAKKIGVEVVYVRSQEEADIKDGRIYITNYELIEKFKPAAWGAVVLDESSILKSLAGKTRRKLTDMFVGTPYRLCCTATPAPNDIAEIANHAEFLGIMTRAEMLSAFFVHDDEGWRLRGHARQAFYRWLASWGMSLRKPSDLGYDDDGFRLPPLRVNLEVVQADYIPDGQLFFTGLKGITDRLAVRRETMKDRVERLADIVNNDPGQWIVWCNLNQESSMAAAAIPDAVEVRGSDSLDEKIEALEAFQDGSIRVLVTKPSIAGFGMNFQNCHKVAFLGLNDSFEQYYQAVRRVWRFGQKHPVDVYIVIADVEKEIWNNVQAKEQEAMQMSMELIKFAKEYEKLELKESRPEHIPYEEETIETKQYTLMLGDAVERMKEIPDESIDLSVFSPPFMDLYTYSPTERDLGNSANEKDFFMHFGYIIDELLRVTKPGRICAVHTADIPALLSKDGYIGLRDFPGKVISAFENKGWIYYGRVTIQKNPQAQAIRTHSKALLFVQLRKDSAWSRPAIGDYILIFRKPGDNAIPITPVENGEIDNETWIKWAHPVWYGIRESDTLQFRTAKGPNDDKHICPLQLGVIERCIKLWSNPGETVLSPFMGIGSEVYQAVKFGRRGIGIELKREYFDAAVRNLERLVREKEQSLFDEGD